MFLRPATALELSKWDFFFWKCVRNMHQKSDCCVKQGGPKRSNSLFKKHFIEILKSLDKFSQEWNSGTRKVAFQLSSTVGQTTFILALCIINKNHFLLEPVRNKLQSKALVVIKFAEHNQYHLQLQNTSVLPKKAVRNYLNQLMM